MEAIGRKTKLQQGKTKPKNPKLKKGEHVCGCGGVSCISSLLCHKLSQ